MFLEVDGMNMFYTHLRSWKAPTELVSPPIGAWLENRGMLWIIDLVTEPGITVPHLRASLPASMLKLGLAKEGEHALYWRMCRRLGWFRVK